MHEEGSGKGQENQEPQLEDLSALAEKKRR